ncbi:MULTISPECIES: DUF2827 domain-containing protein [unclassified Caballeronia]|uniref:DUF2827 domain-containing protein n=1 Tax=unclassified Caballeronia TaxID=2646786 RepID=UPI00285F7015|nr:MULTISPECIES: DUF2827 domain-containing protein [unclassified Caballeronia]MDR5739853.1 DUF2827 domain-containing protein [Caballeronia sp. LZ016]MDR5808318.1 DUF2827 domain-containing protein [Caballeronia sp. LZ019]
MSSVNNTSKKPSARKLRVGVSVYVRGAGQSMFESGIAQNALFLIMLLARSPNVEAVYIVASGDGTREDAKRFMADAPAPLIEPESALGRLDVMIEMAAQLSHEWVTRFRERGGKIVSMRVGNDYVLDIECMVFGLPPAGLVSQLYYDAMWTLPEYERTGKPYFQALGRAPVTIVPHIWSPMLLEKDARNLPEGLSFGYQPGKRRWRVGIFEPNVSMVKTSYVPLLACECAHRADPNVLDAVRVYGTAKLKEQPTFIEFARNLDVVRHNLASFEARFPFAQIVPREIDAIVSHQWENAQNYLYYEALHGGYPLIHNSDMIGDCGYRYHGFDCEDGGRALREAFERHDANLEAYRATARAFLRTLDPLYEANIRAYSEALDALFQKR